MEKEMVSKQDKSVVVVQIIGTVRKLQLRLLELLGYRADSKSETERQVSPVREQAGR